MSGATHSPPQDWRSLVAVATELREQARAGGWPAVARLQETLRAALTAGTTKVDPAAAAAAAQVLDALQEATRLAEAARAVAARRLLELRAGGRAVAAYSSERNADHRRD